MSVSKPHVLDELRRIKGPDLEGNIVDLGLVSEILVKDDRVYFSITVPAARAEELEPLRKAAETVVGKVPGVSGVTAVLTAEAARGAPPVHRHVRRRARAWRRRGRRPRRATVRTAMRTITVTRMAIATPRRPRRSHSRGPARSRWPRCPASKR